MRSHPHGLEEGKTPVQETPEEYRRRLKQDAARKKAADEEEELRRLNVASYDWREVRELIETLLRYPLRMSIPRKKIRWMCHRWMCCATSVPMQYSQPSRRMTLN